MLTLRPYQLEAVEAIYRHLREREDNPCAVLPTGSGKTPLIAQLCDDAVSRWRGRVLVLAHVKELLAQSAGTLDRMAPQLGVGLYSAGLKRRDTAHPVIVAGIQSVFRRAAELEAFDLVIIDEAHMIPPDGDGMYQTFLADAKVVNPRLRVVGLTATPFRMTSGLICQPDHFLNAVCFEVGIKELIRDGYLSPLRTKAGAARADTSALHIRGGEFVAGEVEDLMDVDGLVREACAELVRETQDRQSVLIFASGIRHGQHIVEILKRDHGLECGFVTGETPSGERDRLIGRFRRAGSTDLFADKKPLRYLCNVNVLTTGFDAPNVDCVALVRPTMSPGLYYQMVGRGFRLCDGKADCLVLDFGGNVLRHGPVDAIRISDPGAGGGEAPAKECPDCHAVIAAGYATCPQCGHVFPPKEAAQHEAEAATAGILTGQETITEYEVQEVFFDVHTKRGAEPGTPRSMRVEYRIGWRAVHTEWICLEHQGYARAKAVAWWSERSNDPVPTNIEEAVYLAQNDSLAPTLTIKVRSVTGERFDRIVGYSLGEKPPAVFIEGDLAEGEPEVIPAEDDVIPF